MRSIFSFFTNIACATLALYRRSEFFVLWIFVVIALAWLFPSVGAREGIWSLTSFTHYGVTLIFFMYGATISRADFLRGILHWRLHSVIALTTFGIFPAVVAVALKTIVPEESITRDGIYSGIFIGIFFLATLPSTVASSIIFVGMARGNVPAAIVSTTFSSVLGVFLTPLWLAFFLAASPHSLTLFDKVLKTTLVILLPTVIGFFAARWIGTWVKTHRANLRLFDQTIVLLIVYCAFAPAFLRGTFHSLAYSTFAILVVAMVFLFFIIFGATGILCRAAKLNAADTITAKICASQKSLMHATVMGALLFTAEQETGKLGLILLPMMLYHSIQLILSGIIVARHSVADNNG